MKGKITFIQILLLITIILGGITYFEDKFERNKNKSDFSEIQSDTYNNTDERSDDEDIYSNRDENGMIMKYRNLYDRNNDTVGWVRIDGTAIDYPVMHNSQSNAYYLHRDFNRQESNAGIPFLDYQCNAGGDCDNMIIYAHNMKDGTMFHDLLKYSSAEFYNEHKTVRFDTLYEGGEYEIFAVIRTKVGSKNEFKYYEFITAKTPEEFDEFVEKCKKNSLINIDITPKYGEKLLTLSTCSYNTDNERFVVFARKI